MTAIRCGNLCGTSVLLHALYDDARQAEHAHGQSQGRAMAWAKCCAGWIAYGDRKCRRSLATASMKPFASAAITTLGGSVPLTVSTSVATYNDAEPMNANIMEPCKRHRLPVRKGLASPHCICNAASYHANGGTCLKAIFEDCVRGALRPQLKRSGRSRTCHRGFAGGPA